MHPLKILHVIWSAGMGGIGKVVYHLLEEQKKDGDLKAGLLIAKNEGELMNDFKNLQIDLFIVGFRSGMQFDRELLKKCKTIILPFDIIHFHTFNPALAWVANRSGKKLVYTEHGNFGLGRTPSINDRIVRKLQQYFLNHAVDAVTYNSKFSQDVSTQRYGVHPKKGLVIYNGIPSYTIPTAYKSTIDTKVKLHIVSIGRLASVKRFDRLIAAFSKARLSDARLTILGEGPEKAKLQELVKSLNLEEQILFPGYGDSRALLAACDVCVAPTQGEAFGLVALEAYQQGKKIIAFTDGGGLAEIIQPLEPEAVVSSVDELAKLFAKLYVQENNQTSDHNAEKRKEYVKNYSIEKMAAQFKELYTTL